MNPKNKLCSVLDVILTNSDYERNSIVQDTVLVTFNTNATYVVQLLLTDVVAIHITAMIATRIRRELIRSTVMVDLGDAHCKFNTTQLKEVFLLVDVSSALVNSMKREKCKALDKARDRRYSKMWIDT